MRPRYPQRASGCPRDPGGGSAPVAEHQLDEAGTDTEELARATDELAHVGRRWHGLSVGGRLTLARPWPERRGGRRAS